MAVNRNSINMTDGSFTKLYALAMLTAPEKEQEFLKEKAEFEKALSLLGALNARGDSQAPENIRVCDLREDLPAPSFSRDELTSSAQRTDGRFIIVKGIIRNPESGDESIGTE